jgi:aspartate dehydrogenase
MSFPVIVAESVQDMIRHNPVVIVEAASQQAVRDYYEMVLSAGIDLIVMSVGALLDLDLDNGRVHVPSGAIGGLDAVRSAAIAGIKEVVLTSRKNPRALDRSEREEKLVYDGFAEEAVKLFPKEMNVAATLSLAARPARVRVKVVSDPKVDRNVHEVHVEWKQGEMFLRFLNDPHPDNPKTSALAAWSAISLLRDILGKFP